jgi:hypothetical protein
VIAWLVTTAGVVLALLVVRDVFHTLFHPAGQGSIARAVFGLVWRASRRLTRGPAPSGLAGPFGMGAVIGTWVLLSVTAWALVYGPWLPGSFSFSPGLDQLRRSEVLDALYVSLVTISTLGFGDVVPRDGWLRIAAPLQALSGFALLTAAVTWVLGVYPALSRRRAFALHLSALRRAAPPGTWLGDGGHAAAQVLHSLASSVATVHSDLLQYAETYYFREAEPESSLAAGSPRDDVRVAGAALAAALDDLAEHLRGSFLDVGDGAGRAAVLAAFAEDHGHDLTAAG